MIETMQAEETGSVRRTGPVRGGASETPALPPPASLPRAIQRTIRDDRICVLTFDRPGSAANIFDPGTLAELREELDIIAASPQLNGLILASAKRSIFIAGA